MLTTAMLSNITGKTSQTICNWSKRKEFRPYVVMVGRKVMFKDSVLEFIKTHKLTKRAKHNRANASNKPRCGDSICWGCSKSANECMWLRFHIPVEGWVAKKVTNSNHTRNVGYRVQSCPNFKEK